MVVHLGFAAIMARFSCSYVTNITTFQEPRRKNDGMNLKSKKQKNNMIDCTPLQPSVFSPCSINLWFISSLTLSILSMQPMLTPYKRQAVPLWSSWQQHNWGHFCTGPEQHSYILSWPHQLEMQSLLCIALHQRLIQNGRADYLWRRGCKLLLQRERQWGIISCLCIMLCRSHCFTCQGSGLNKCVLDEVICHQFCAVHNCIPCNVRSRAYMTEHYECKWKDLSEEKMRFNT